MMNLLLASLLLLILPISCGNETQFSSTSSTQPDEIPPTSGSGSDSYPISAEGKTGYVDSRGPDEIYTPNNAVTKGSFTVFTTPEDPAPHQDYKIVILIKVPNYSKTYPANDLSGRISGTDGFMKKIDFANSTTATKNQSQELGLAAGALPVIKGRARLEFWIPGGSSKVRDSINVRSQLLSETQAMIIEF